MGKRSNASKFPVARIKKMMQADEDIGKVAQATPVVISKALELFLADIVSAAAKETQSKNSKKVTAYHLKRAVMTTPTLDFLKDHVANVPDPIGTTPSTSSKRSAPQQQQQQKSSDEEEDEQEEDDDEEDYDDEKPPAGTTSRTQAKRVKRE